LGKLSPELAATDTVTYTYGDDLLSQERSTTTTPSFFLYDGLGSTRALADDTGNLTDSYDYVAFGELLNESGTTENSYRYTGEQFDNSLDQYYLRARYYNQGVGRFTQMDTWMGNDSDPITLHKYLYGDVDPGNMVDPSGNLSLLGHAAAQNIRAQLAKTATTTILIGVVAAQQTIETGVNLAFDRRPPHSYETNSVICTQRDPSDRRCNLDKVFELSLQCPAPLLGPNCRSRSVRTGDWGYAHDIAPGGIVTFEVGSYEHVNRTTWAHFLHEGTIRRSVRKNGNRIEIHTLGVGVNYTAFFAWMNQRYGPRIFKGLDRDIQYYYDKGSYLLRW
jgi:RHS repeat-associated protein